MQLFLRKFIHEVTSITTVDCRDNYSDIQHNSTCKAGSALNKCTWSSRDCICSIFYFTNHLLNASLKRKTSNICIIIRRMTTEKAARAVGVLRQAAGVRQVSRLSRECLQILVSCWHMSQFTINQTELIIFRSPGISDAGIRRLVACTDGRRNRYVLL